MRARARGLAVRACAAVLLAASGAGAAGAKPWGPLAQDLLLRLGPPMPVLAVKLLWVPGAVLAGAGGLRALWLVLDGRKVPWAGPGAIMAFGAAPVAAGLALEGDRLPGLLRPPEWRGR